MTHNDAFLLVQVFRRRALPALLRKLHLWKGLNQEQHSDLLEDLDQELWLDCLQNADLIVSLPSRDRHTRWFRLIERKHYHLHTRGERVRATDAVLDGLADREERDAPYDDATAFDPVQSWGRELPVPQRRFLRRISTSARYLKNGRINCRESAQRLGLRPDDLSEVWCQIAADLGFGSEFLGFWRRRLGEALVGLGADLLRDRGLVAVHGEERRRRPDPRGRLRRMRQLRAHLSWRPMPPDIKHVLTRYHRRTSARGLDPRVVLADAVLIAPFDPAVRLWEFEAHLAARDLGGAVAAIRAARRCDADRVPVRLARARVLELRHREAAARRLLESGPAAERRDPRLREALRRLAG